MKTIRCCYGFEPEILFECEQEKILEVIWKRKEGSCINTISEKKIKKSMWIDITMKRKHMGKIWICELFLCPEHEGKFKEVSEQLRKKYPIFDLFFKQKEEIE